MRGFTIAAGSGACPGTAGAFPSREFSSTSASARCTRGDVNRPIQQLFPDARWWFSPPYTTFTTALVLLGLSAAFGAPWMERRGPRAAATAAALFFGSGLLIGGFGRALAIVPRVPGIGIVGGIGYISPVSTLVK